MRGRIENPLLRWSDVRRSVGCHEDGDLVTGEIVTSAIRLVVGDNLVAAPLERNLEWVRVAAVMSGEIVEGGCGCSFGDHGRSSRGEASQHKEADCSRYQKWDRNRPSFRLQGAQNARSGPSTQARLPAQKNEREIGSYSGRSATVVACSVPSAGR